jgi:lysophospholipase L1-like esterase
MVTFAGRRSVLVAPGRTVFSDPIHLAVRPMSRVLISIYLPTATGPATEHRDARQINYVAPGDHSLDVSGGAFADETGSWFFLAGIDALAPSWNYGAVVALGDSITDGLGSPVNANERWPNFLARRLSTMKGKTLSVVDEGIGGNRVLDNSSCCGVSAVTRFAPDVRGQPSARIMILLEGINDIGLAHRSLASPAADSDVLARRIIGAYRRIIRLAHVAGIQVFGGTLTPFQGALYWTPEGEVTREAVNHWIRTSGAFDGVIDFARATRARFDPTRLAPAYDSGDHLHLNAAGYRAMASAVNLAALFRDLGSS